MGEKIARKPDHQPGKRDTTINVRMSSRTKALIDTAASSIGKTRSEFITESARRHAIDILLDQRLYVIEGKQFDAFDSALQNPPAVNAKLKALMKKQPLWRS